MEGLSRHIGVAIKAGFYFEAISFRLPIIDYWLRIYWRNTRPEGEPRRLEESRGRREWEILRGADAQPGGRTDICPGRKFAAPNARPPQCRIP